MSLLVYIDGGSRRFEDADDLARHLAYRSVEGICGQVKCPSLSDEEFGRVIAQAAGYYRELRPDTLASED